MHRRLWISLFLAALDSTIISTAVFDISNSFNSTSKSAWIVTSYLLTYNAFVLLIAKLSDTVGLKPLILASNGIFLVFSIACGVAKTVEQLIVFRAFQGIGASGLYCLVFIAIMRLITLEKTGFYPGIISSVFAISNLLGPILGGVIVDSTTWRWIFYINIPLALIASVILALAIPASNDVKFDRHTFRRFDFVGSLLSICWLIPLLFALQEGGSSYPWSSGEVIGTLTAGIAALIIFLAHQTWLQYRNDSAREPIFPVKFVCNPLQSLLLLSVLLSGFAFYTSIIILPQRFQAFNDVSASRAGILLLTLTLSFPFFTFVAGAVLSKKPQLAFHLLILGTSLILASTACLSTLSNNRKGSNSQYGFEVLMGTGLGIITTTQYVVLKITFSNLDMAAATGAMNMLRALGGCIGLAICAAMLASRLEKDLPSALPGSSAEQIQAARNSLHQGNNGFSPDEIAAVRMVYGQGYDDGFRVMIVFAGANVLVSGILFLTVKGKGGVGGLIEAAKAEEQST
ncbi:putative MFS multidrug transporter [Aspergillus stella-maris]|uniref:putative MFS multidrug transporter n=1 Tax=Aspergillus stella-maris TaxID=1810926 RepID=UPI003CCC96FF